MEFKFVKPPLSVWGEATFEESVFVFDKSGELARIGPIDGSSHDGCKDETQLAHLFSAAPELLESIEQILVWIENWNPDFTHDPDWSKQEQAIKSAIAKAYGK